MQAVDFSKLLDTEAVGRYLPARAVPAEDVYERFDGVQFRVGADDGELLQEVVRLGNGAFLFASDFSSHTETRHCQIVQDTDWVHLQFRVNGGGREQFSQGATIETPEGSCIVARYPKDCLIEREIDSTAHWKVACLLVSPRGLTELLDAPASRLPERIAWMTAESRQDLRAEVVPLQSKMKAAVHDVLSCSIRGSTRRAYMRAKSLELLTMVIHALDATRVGSVSPRLRLSARDLSKIALSRNIMAESLENHLTLAELARRVGLSRTKLVLGFKEVYGTSVQAYWRDAKLDRAREMLSTGDASVKEVAFKLGYSEISSFTRAFSRKFGMPPSECGRPCQQTMRALGDSSG